MIRDFPICDWSGLMRISCPPECPDHGNGWSQATPAELNVMGNMIEPSNVHHIRDLEQITGRRLTAYRVIQLDQPADVRRTPDEVKRPSRGQSKETKADRAHRQLMELPDELALLPDVLTGAGGEPEAGGKREHPPIPIRAVVTDMLDGRRKPWHDAPVRLGPDSDGKPYDDVIRDPNQPTTILVELAMWVRIADEDMGKEGVAHTEPATVPTVATETDWLLRHWVWITSAEWCDDLFHSIGRMLHEIRAAMGEQPEYQPRCEKCGWRLQPQDDGAWYRCAGCGRVVDHWAEMKRIMALQEAPLRDIAGIINVPVKTLYRWKDEGRIRHINKRGREHMFDVADVRAVAEREFGRKEA